MRGPKIMAVAILAFFGVSMLAVHLMYLPEAGPPERRAAAATASPGPPVVATGLALAPAAPAVSAAPVMPAAAPVPAGEGSDLGGLPSLGVTGPFPAPTASAEWERKLNDCIERNIHDRGYDEFKPTAPGRWPAMKRAREKRRLLRLQARTACERELAG